MPFIRKFIIIPLLMIPSVIVFCLIESALRLAYLQEPLTYRNFTVEPVYQQVSKFAFTYESVIGYIAKAGYRDGHAYSHGEMGIRLNRTLSKNESSPPIMTGGILAVGDSFTYGSEVTDAESWPAQLERIIGIPVVNGGAGGYGTDQAALRAEQLLDLVKPRMIIFSFIPNCIGRNEYSVNVGLIKPYFDVKNEGLTLENVPVPYYQPSVKHVGWIRKIFGYSYAITWAAERVGWGQHWQVTQGEVRKVHDKGANVSCLLWSRLAEKIMGRGIVMVVLAQYAGIQVNGHDNSRDSYKVEKVLECARREGFIIIDSFPELKRRFEADEGSFWKLWVRQAHDKSLWHTGHMSAEGNLMTAELLAKGIRMTLPVPVMADR